MQKMDGTKPAAEPLAQQPPPTPSLQEIETQVSAYVGWPEKLLQKSGIYKHPFL